MTLLSYGVLKSSGGAIMRTKLAAVFLILLITALSLTGCTGFSKNETVAEGHFDFYVSDLGTRAFPAFFYWEGDPNDTLIEIPDKLGSADIGSVGGFFGTGNPIPMIIATRGSDPYKMENPPEGVEALPITFTLSIGKNIRSIVRVITPEYLSARDIDGTVRWYEPKLRVELREDNPKFYEHNGRLYYKEDDRLVDSIGYGAEMVSFQKGTLSEYGTMAYATEYEWVKTLSGATLTKYEGAWQYDENTEREDCVAARIEGGQELYDEICRLLSENEVFAWDGFHKSNSDVLDGGGFSFSMTLDDGNVISASGTNAYPGGYREFVNGLSEILDRASEI